MTHHLSLVSYNQAEAHYYEDNDAAAVIGKLDATRSNWVLLAGYEDEQAVRALLNHFTLPPLLHERIINAEHLDEVEEYDNCIFFTFRYYYFKGRRNGQSVREDDFININGAFICGTHFLLTFVDTDLPIFERIRTRLLNGQGEIRKHGADFLLYTILRREFVDYYGLMLKHLYQALEELEDDVLETPGEDEDYRRLLNMRSILKPFNSYILNLLENVELFHDEQMSFISKDTMKRFDKSLYREAQELWVTYQQLRQFITELVEIHRANVSEKMNRVMQLLAGVSVVFLPLTFMAGVYGMNFENTPDFQWHWGYYATLVMMAIVSATLLLYMRRRDWIPD